MVSTTSRGHLGVYRPARMRTVKRRAGKSKRRVARQAAGSGPDSPGSVSVCTVLV